MPSIETKQKIEIEFWRNSKEESPQSDSLENIINKVSDSRIFVDCLKRHNHKIPKSGRVLELGAGQGWASCVYKRLFPQTYVITTDISEHAIMSLPKWERLFDTRIDKSYSCTSYNIDEDNESIDFIFCFSAAHHFLAHKRTINEIKRVLKPGGIAAYFHEPVTPRYLYSLAHWRVNHKRPDVPEDVLINSEYQKLAQSAGLSLDIDYFPSLVKRGSVETLYFLFLNQFPLFQKVLPCSANYLFTQEK